MTAKHIALIYIGQSPRVDITPDITENLPQCYRVTEIGALDGLSMDEIARLAPSCKKDHTLVTKLNGGGTATVCEERILPLIQHCVNKSEAEGADICAVMCTGSFPELKSTAQLITTDEVFHKNVKLGNDISTVGLIVPKAEQMAEFAAQYAHLNKTVVTAFASPYDEDELIIKAAKELVFMGADIIMLDCMGYTPRHMALVCEATGVETRIPRLEVCKAMR